MYAFIDIVDVMKRLNEFEMHWVCHLTASWELACQSDSDPVVIKQCDGSDRMSVLTQAGKRTCLVSLRHTRQITLAKSQLKLISKDQKCN